LRYIPTTLPSLRHAAARFTLMGCIPATATLALGRPLDRRPRWLFNGRASHTQLPPPLPPPSAVFACPPLHGSMRHAANLNLLLQDPRPKSSSQTSSTRLPTGEAGSASHFTGQARARRAGSCAVSSAARHTRGSCARPGERTGRRGPGCDLRRISGSSRRSSPCSPSVYLVSLK
jgi:hypothetical protein